MNPVKFFRKSDWLACGLTFIIALIGYVMTLQPTLGLEDSGELIVASDYLGVPHPPGYPIWTLLTWFFQWIFHAVTFHGHPNPAWAVNLFSGVSGAAACAVLALLISRSGFDILRSMKKESESLGEKTETTFCCVAGISAGLLLAFGQGMWSQSVIAEVYALNIFFQTLILLFLYRWMAEPKNTLYLFLCAFTFGIGFTNHQTLMFMGAAIAIAILFRDFNLFRDFAITALFFIFMLVINKVAAGTDWSWLEGPSKIGFWIWTAYCVVIPIIAGLTLKNGKTVCITFLIMFIGLAFYLYMPISSDQNPPINWGYPRTWEGFMHAITRGQYERVKVAHVLSDPARFIHQCEAFFVDLRSQYLPLVLTGFLPFTAWRIKKFNAALVSIALFIISALLLTFSTIASIKFADSPDLPAQLTKMAIPFIIGLFLLFAVGFAMTITNFIEHCVKKIKTELWPKKDPWSTFSALIIGLIGVLSAIIAIYISGALLYSLFNKNLSNTATESLIIFLAATLPICLIVGLFLLQKKRKIKITFSIAEPQQHWFITTMVAFVATSIIFLIIWNPKTDIQSLFIGRVQFIQPHAIFAIWMGYGLLITMAYIDALFKNNKACQLLIIVGILSLPVFIVVKNYVDPHQNLVVGGAEQNNHDFGWQFGNWQLRGVDGIKDDLRYWYKDDQKFEEQWANYPCKNYPQPMGSNAIFFGGTDPGRFVPTYMIYSAKVRQDVYLITQNALADNTYMNVMRDLYGDQIWIPSPSDSSEAFRLFYESEREQGGISQKNGKLQVQGVQHVMKINGFLSKMIFDHNQYITEAKTNEKTRPVGSARVYQEPTIDPKTGNPETRSFYVEESYVLPWMYPYLTPNGLIMKINNKPTNLSKEVIDNDTAFWAWNCDRLINDSSYMRDIAARRSFSKLRSSLAGLYAARGKLNEAEAAFKQAVLLYDLSPEANFRLADLISKRGRPEEAIAILDTFLKKDKNNVQAAKFRESILQQQKVTSRRVELETVLKGGKIDYLQAVELMKIYYSLGNKPAGNNLAQQLISSGNMAPEMLMSMAQLLADPKIRNYATTELALKKYMQLKPDDTQGLLNLAGLQIVLNKQQEALANLKKAISIGGEAVRNRIRQDQRFNAIRNTPQFKRLVPPLMPAKNNSTITLPNWKS